MAKIIDNLSANFDALPPPPADADLRRLVHFSVGDGRIWLAGHRMVLLHAEALAAFRRELMHTIGPEQTRRVSKRAGYASGLRDAALARQVRPHAGPWDQFVVGPQLHMLEGAVQVTPESCTFDVKSGTFHGIFRWDHSWEVETHVRDFGPQDEPVCWMLLGYASGYTTGFMGQQILFKETHCVACGDDHCLIEGRLVHDWPDGERMRDDYEAATLLVRRDEASPPEAEIDRASQQPSDDLGELIGHSRAFEQAIDLLRKAAQTRVTVMLTGETGVGKERFARTLHKMSARANKPFVAVNCAALPQDLIESELFGAEKGAYTGAANARPGRFERADGGTLFLDELGEMSMAAQAKLLRVLQNGEVERLGSTVCRKVDVRVVAATNTDLEAAVASGHFRRDLLYRLNVYPIAIPSLRERVDDIELLANHLLEQFMARHGKHVAGITDRAMDAMRRHPWPGNVRELENLIERGLIVTPPGQMVDVGDLFGTPDGACGNTVGDTGELQQSVPPDIDTLFDDLRRRGLNLDSLEDVLIKEAVSRAGGNLAAAARSLGLTRPQLSYRLQKIQGR